MEPNAPFRRMVRGFYAWIGAMLFAVVAPLAAMKLIQADTLASRVAGVAIGAVGWIPMIWFVSAVIRIGDEFQRRMHLVAIAVAFAAGLILLGLVDWLARADFIWPPDLMAIWVGFAGLWAVSLLVVKRHYERHP